VRGLKSAGEAELNHRCRDRDLHGDDGEQSPHAPLPGPDGPPDEIADERVGEHAVRPVNRREWAGLWDDLSVAQWKPAARRHGAQVRRQRTEQDSKERESQRDRRSPTGTRRDNQRCQQEHGGREVKDDHHRRQAGLHSHRAEEDLEEQHAGGDGRSAPVKQSQREYQDR